MLFMFKKNKTKIREKLQTHYQVKREHSNELFNTKPVQKIFNFEKLLRGATPQYG